ncbi:MAG: hypothetical protein RLY14_641 [Planctomycetota bacterium]
MSLLFSASRAANVLNGHARLSLLEESDDLLVGKSCSLHTRHSPKLADYVPPIWYGSKGAGQPLHKGMITLSLRHRSAGSLRDMWHCIADVPNPLLQLALLGQVRQVLFVGIVCVRWRDEHGRRFWRGVNKFN